MLQADELIKYILLMNRCFEDIKKYDKKYQDVYYCYGKLLDDSSLLYEYSKLKDDFKMYLICNIEN